MTITGVVARVRVSDLEAAVPFYEAVTGQQAAAFSFGAVRLAAVGPFLLFSALDAEGDRLATVRATLVTDDLDHEVAASVGLGAEVVAAPAATPNGRRAVIRHPDGSVFEYVGRSTSAVARSAGSDVDVSAVDAAALDISEVVELYRSVGWMRYAERPEELQSALIGSSRVVVARRADRLIGLARVISDGVTIAYLQDVLVAPGARRSGIGRALVGTALEPYAAVRQKVLLTDDDPEQRSFYESLGYTETHEYANGILRAFVRFDT